MAKAHTELLEFKEAYDLVNGVLGKDPKNKDFLKLIEEIQKAVRFISYYQHHLIQL